VLVLTQAFWAMWYVETLAKAVGQIVSTVAKATHVAWGRNSKVAILFSSHGIAVNVVPGYLADLASNPS
jgi:hypothetical protein